MAWNWDDDAGEYLWTDEVYTGSGGIDDGGFNPADLPEAKKSLWVRIFITGTQMVHIPAQTQRLANLLV